jgi:hypothetical protein
VSNVFALGYALLIGVGGDLPTTVQDAVALRDLLINKNRAAYHPEQVRLLTETAASRQGILDAFDRWIEQVNHNPDAIAIVYFSGHGGRIERPGKPYEYYLVPYGYDPSRRAATAVSGWEFTDKIEAIRASKLIVLLDCCHAGGVPAVKESSEVFIKSPVPPEMLNMLQSASGRVIAASSHEEEKSYTGKPYSVFTSCLLEALQGKAAVNRDGFARILDVLIYLFKHVPERAPGSQHPFVKKVLDLGDNFPVCYYAGGNKSLPGELPTEPISMPGDLTAGRRHRLEQQLDALRQEWDLRTEKVRRLRAASAIEVDVAVTFKVERQILQEEHTLAYLCDRLNEIEQALQ